MDDFTFALLCICGVGIGLIWLKSALRQPFDPYDTEDK